jgi:hypothetical protein
MDKMEKKLAKQLEKQLKNAAVGKTKVIVNSVKVVKGFDTYGRDYRIAIVKPKEDIFYLVRVFDNALMMPYTNDTNKNTQAVVRKVLYDFLVK